MLIATIFQARRIVQGRSGSSWSERRMDSKEEFKNFKIPFPKALQCDVGLGPVLEMQGVAVPTDLRVVDESFIKYQTQFLIVSGDHWTHYTKNA